MPELREQIFAILSAPQLAVLATVTEGSKPWVRYVMAVTGEDMKIRFATHVKSRKVSQIAKNPEVHLTCGAGNLETTEPFLQIEGRAELTTDESERHAFWNDELKDIFQEQDDSNFGVLKDTFQGPDDPNYGVIVVTPYRIEYCEPGKFEPKVWTAGQPSSRVF
jgi:general stress protein 26